MVAYNFPQSMVRPVIFGEKTSCLKPHGKRTHVKVGGPVTAVTGMLPPEWSRSSDFHRLMDAPCTKSEPVVLDAAGIILAGQRVTNMEWYRVCAKSEGFAEFEALQASFERRFGLPWQGQYVRWNPAEASFRAQWPLVVKPPIGAVVASD